MGLTIASSLRNWLPQRSAAIIQSGLAVLILLLLACDPMTTVTLDNVTTEKLAFYLQSDVQAALLGSGSPDAGTSFREWTVPAGYTWLRVAATREDGEWVFDHKYTRSELEEAKGMVSVGSLATVAPPADVRVLPSYGAPVPVAPRVTFVNSTAESLEFYTKTDVQSSLTLMAVLSAASSWQTPSPRFHPGTITGTFDRVQVTARREDGELVFERVYSWDELQKERRRFVVSSPNSIGAPPDGKENPR